jgi:Transposase protein
VPRGGERALARWGLLGEGADPAFVPGAQYPLAGLLLALPALEATGLLDCARQVYGRLRNGYYGLAATLLTLVFLALAGEPRAEGATRVPPGALGRVLGLDRAPEVMTIRRKLGELADAGKAADLIMTLARRHRCPPEGAGVLCADGHARAYYGTRNVQKMHVARLKFPAPATGETWVTSQYGGPVFIVVAEPSQSLAGELRRLLPRLREVVGEGRRVTVCFDRGGWSAALFADITEARFDLLTWRKGPAPDLPAGKFTTITCADDRGREHEYDLADTTITLNINEGPRKGQTVTLRQVTRRVPARHGATRQIHALTSRHDLAAGEVCWRMTSRWREELLPLRPHPVRSGRPRLLRRRPGRPRPAGPQPGEESRRPGPSRRGPRRLGRGHPRRGAARTAQPGTRPAGHHHQPDDQRPGRPGRAPAGNSKPPRTPRQPSPPASALVRWLRTWSTWRPRSSRSPTPSGWPPTTPRPPWPAPWTAATPAPATKPTPSSAKL